MKTHNDRHVFTADEAFAVTAGALRYALGRHTYSTTLVWGLIKEHWHDPEVARQRECIKSDIEKYVDAARADHESAEEAVPALETAGKTLVSALDRCRAPGARAALHRVLETAWDEQARLRAVPKYPDLDIGHTWLPALEWIKEHMNDPVEGCVQ